MNVLTAIQESFRDAANYNSHEVSAPAVILWPDEGRHWTQTIDDLRADYPLLWTLGDYDHDRAVGPAAWVRYQIASQEGADIPVIYLPGIGRAAFRDAEQCPSDLIHLFALQFQGQFWTQANGRDWTPFAFLSSSGGGLGLEVAADQETKRALHECLRAVLKKEVSELKTKKLEAEDFRELVTPDPARTLLRWMSNPARIRQELENSGSEWTNFCAVCKKQYHFDPQKDGAITAAEKLLEGKGAWPMVWQRFKDSPTKFPGMKRLLETIPLPDLFGEANEYRPLSNARSEKHLEQELLALNTASSQEALAAINTLGTQHAPRARWVWATLGDSPLAIAMGHLAQLAETVEAPAALNTWQAVTDYYITTGWKADRSVLRTLSSARSASATKAVSAAIRAIYLPWLEKLAGHLQAFATSYPTVGPASCRTFPVKEGTVYLFADGMRMDIAKDLAEQLFSSAEVGHVSFDAIWAALPTVTATAKPAWMPLAAKLGGPLEGSGFEAVEQVKSKALTQPRFKQLLSELEFTFLDPGEVGAAAGCAWTECGSVDTYGHAQGAKLAWRVDEELEALKHRVSELLRTGWTEVRVVTDHGWLMMPGGLPKVDLPKHLTASRWSRCAKPDPGAQHGYPVTPWFWDAAEAVVLAPGVACFSNGIEYAHGGLTVQEALIPSLTVTGNQNALSVAVTVKELKWAGLRLNLILEGAQGLTVDIRGKVADPASSFATSPTKAPANGKKTSLLVADDEAAGTAAFLVLLNENSDVVHKRSIVIGEN